MVENGSEWTGDDSSSKTCCLDGCSSFAILQNLKFVSENCVAFYLHGIEQSRVYTYASLHQAWAVGTCIYYS